MSVEQHNYLKLTVKRRADTSPLDWFFDLKDQARMAIELCEQNSEVVENHNAQWQHEGPPANDFVSDAHEFKNWLLDLEA